MAHKNMVGGTAYDTKGGRCLVGGTGYAVKKGRTLVDGTGYDVNFIEKFNLTITSTGSSYPDCATVTVDGVVYKRDASTHVLEVAEGTVISCSATNLGDGSTLSYIYLNGEVVKKFNTPTTATYEHTVTSNVSVSLETVSGNGTVRIVEN